MAITFHDPDEAHWIELEQQDMINQARKRPLARAPYSHPNDTNIQIYPEPRHYGMRTGFYEQI